MSSAPPFCRETVCNDDFQEGVVSAIWQRDAAAGARVLGHGSWNWFGWMVWASAGVWGRGDGGWGPSSGALWAAIHRDGCRLLALYLPMSPCRMTLLINLTKPRKTLRTSGRTLGTVLKMCLAEPASPGQAPKRCVMMSLKHMHVSHDAMHPTPLHNTPGGGPPPCGQARDGNTKTSLTIHSALTS